MGDHAWRITLYNIHTDDTLYSRVQLHVYMHIYACRPVSRCRSFTTDVISCFNREPFIIFSRFDLSNVVETKNA